ncbi:ABC transporter permease subunit [Cupriavidus necator]
MVNAGSSFRAVTLGLGYFFLYAPIAALIVYSFNASQLVTLWGGFSLRWYASLMHDDELIRAAWLSFRIAVLTASASTILGTLAGFSLARSNGLRGISWLSAMLDAVLVLPEVILGISLLLLFVELEQWFGWPAGRGALTIWLGHVMLTVAYVSVIVHSRLRDQDRLLEDAAMDLGATPLKVFFAITLPQMWQAVLAGWLLAFTLSLDDVVVASFLSGPGASTLPLVVFSRVRLGLNPEMNALATILVASVTVCAVLLNTLTHPPSQRG